MHSSGKLPPALLIIIIHFFFSTIVRADLTVVRGRALWQTDAGCLRFTPVSLRVVYAPETTEEPLISALTDLLLRRLYEQKFPSFNLNPFIPNKLGAPTGGTLVYNGDV